MSRNHGNTNRSNLVAGTSIFSAAVGIVATLAAVEHAHAQENDRESIIQGVGRWVRDNMFDSSRTRLGMPRHAAPRALTNAEIGVLPIRTFSPHHALETDVREACDEQNHDACDDQKPFCVVCREQYDVGDTLMRMPCFHEFHAECIRDYLHATVGPLCPICRHPVSIS